MPSKNLYTKLLQVSGSDAAKFLQGQLSCDVNAVPTLGSYCNIKGKVECIFKMIQSDQNFLLSMPDSIIDGIMQELQKYAVFSKVSLAIIPNDCIERDPAQEITAKIAEIYPTTQNIFFPHDLNLPALGAVSFKKGCYRGQEIVARMHHRGNLKRDLYIFTTEAQPQPGDPVMLADSDQAVGKIVRIHANTGLAVINIANAHMQMAVLKLARSL